MLNISHNPDFKLRLIGHGYHTSDRGKKYVRILKRNCFYFIQVKLLAHKDLHVHYPTAAPYKFVGSFLELELYGDNIPPCEIETLIDQRLNGVWFE
jgi:hypothetical protein